MNGPKAPRPQWITTSLVVKEGRDPLGFQTTTQDRLMPMLLPGILELSRRARYFSFHAFLLDEYRLKRLPANRNSLSTFIKSHEWDLGLAVQRCPNNCGFSPVGARRLGNQAAGSGPFPRGESVVSDLGGYGLYYRSPMASLGIVAKAGTLLGEQPIPIDVLRPTVRAARLVDGFRSAIEQTAYYRRWMWTNNELPVDVVDEYAAVACLCRLRERSDERDAVQDALFGSDPPDHLLEPEPGADDDRMDTPKEPLSEDEVVQRRRSTGHYLTLIRADPNVVHSESAYRDALWSPPAARSDGQALVAGQWAALIAKDIWQEAICSVWAEFCRAGLSHTRNLGRGLMWNEVSQVAAEMVNGPPQFLSDHPTSLIVEELSAGRLTSQDPGSAPFEFNGASPEMLRQFTLRLDNATSGLAVLLEVARRSDERSDSGWQQAMGIDSAWQDSMAEALKKLQIHLAEAPTIGESLWWIVSNLIIRVHERISYSKLPEFTFRFRWEDGFLRFYDHGVGRFPLAAIRNESLASLTLDLDMWRFGSDADAGGELTTRGADFLNEALL